MSESWDAPMRAWLQSHAGIVSVATLKSFGCKRRSAYRLAGSNEFELIMPGVLRSTHWPLGPQQWMFAACARNEHASVAILSAAKEWRFRGLPSFDDVYVLVPESSSPTMPGVIVRRCRSIDPADIVCRDDGLRLTSPARTLFDCADILGAAKTASILEQLINEGRGSFVTHAQTFTRLAARRRPGTRTMAAVLQSRPPWRAALQSDLEARVLAEIERQGLPAPVVQLRYLLPGGRRVRLDFAWPQFQLALEIDHPFWHRDPEDKRRDLAMATLGWQTLRVENVDVEIALAAAIAQVGAVMAHR